LLVGGELDMPKVLLLVISFCCISSAVLAEPIDRSDVFVKDGDTIIVPPNGYEGRAKDEEYRLVDFDAPETSQRAKCPVEIEKGIRAAARLIALLDSGSLDLTEVKCSCSGPRCNYGRRCGRLRVDGKDVGQILISEGHAVPYDYARRKRSTSKNHNWCGVL
jgi:micrococcal nuclease